MKIKVSSIIIIILILLTINIPYLSSKTNNILNLIESLVILSWIITKKMDSLIKKNWYIFLFSIIVVICTFINFGFENRTITAIVLGIKVVSLFLSCEYICNKHGKDFLLNKIFTILIFMFLIVDSLIIFTQGKGIGGDGVLNYFLIGNKFGVSYYHLLFLSIFNIQTIFIKNKKLKNITFFLIFILSIYICKLVDCNTGLIGCTVVFILSILKNKITTKFVLNGNFFIILFIGLTFLLVGTDALITNPFVQNFIVNVLHRSPTLTGRLQMYQIAINAINLKPLLGHGINSTIIEDILTWGNPQNGLLKMLLDFGYVGTIIFLNMCLNSFKNKKNNNLNEQKYFISIFLIAMIVCSMVEVNIAGTFYLGLALINSFNQYKEEL